MLKFHLIDIDINIMYNHSIDFPFEEIDVLKKKTAEKPGKVFDNDDVIIMSSSDGPKTDYEVQHER